MSEKFDLKEWALSPSRFNGDYEKRKAVRELLAENERLEKECKEFSDECRERILCGNELLLEASKLRVERDELKVENDAAFAACAAKDEERIKIWTSAYETGHNDTVDGVWTYINDVEQAAEAIQEMTDEGTLSAGPEIMAVVEGKE